MKCVLLTTDTKHHRFFANRISQKAQTTVVLEQGKLNHGWLYWHWVRRKKSAWSLIDNPYLQPSYHKFNRLQEQFEERFFTKGKPFEFADCSAIHSFYSVNDPECVQTIRAIRPHLIISFGTGLIKQDILHLDSLKINIHRGILPKYRGLDADLWSFYYCDFENVGTTVHKLEPRFDTGNILSQERLKLQTGMKAHQIRYFTTLLATEMVETLIQNLQNGDDLDVTIQDLSQGTYYSYVPPLKRIVSISRFNKYIRSLS